MPYIIVDCSRVFQKAVGRVVEYRRYCRPMHPYTCSNTTAINCTRNGPGPLPYETGVRYCAMFGPNIGVSFWASICYFKTRLPFCALGTSFYTVSEGRDLMTYVSDNYTSYSAPSPLKTGIILSAMYFNTLGLATNLSKLIISSQSLLQSTSVSLLMRSFHLLTKKLMSSGIALQTFFKYQRKSVSKWLQQNKWFASGKTLFS